MDANTKLLEHFDSDVDGSKSLLDSGNTGHIVSAAGTAITSTAQKKFGKSSLLLDGNSDYATVPDHADWDFGDGDFVIEFWVKCTDPESTDDALVTAAASINISAGWATYISYAGGYVRFYTNTLTLTGSTDITDDAWHHVAISRNSGDINLYVDGTREAQTTSYATAINTAVRVTLGQFSTLQAGRYLNGNLDEVRISKGTNRGYTGATITVPTAPFTSDANTALLLHCECQDVSGDGGSGLYHPDTYFGTAQLDTSQYKWGTSSLLLDGNSDYITLPDSSDWDLLADNQQDYTLDFWFRSGKIAGPVATEMFASHGVTNNWWQFSLYNGSALQLYAEVGAGAIISFQGGDVTDQDWHHIALCKVTSAGPTTQWGIYVDGTQTAYVSDNSEGNFTSSFFIGKNAKSGTYWLDGHLDEYRINASNIFTASPNVGKTDTITVPTGPDVPATGKIFQAIMF